MNTCEYELSLNELQGYNPLFESIENFVASGGHIIFLEGDIGIGKTSLVQYYAQWRGIGGVTSPTFALAQSYADDFWHYDCYRYSLDDVLGLGMLDLLTQKGLHFVEWGKDLVKICVKLGIIPLLNIEIMDAVAHKRRYRIWVCTH